MSITNDIKRVHTTDPQWYQKIWTLSIQDMSWVEQTKKQVDFIIQVLDLQGSERLLDLACGFGRHTLEFARRGYEVVGADITPDYITEANRLAAAEGLHAEFLCTDLRDLDFQESFDVVLNLADGAIGYLENDAENLKIFDLIAAALKPGGKHLMDVCNTAYAAKHFPRRNWIAGEKSLSLADFEWDGEKSLMFYAGLTFKYGEPLVKPEALYSNPTRLYSVQELKTIFQSRGMNVLQAFGDFDAQTPATDDTFQIQVISHKLPE